jgi:glyoxylase-like metal-dependent hydrolase (beta-lactamase superfamily II)
MNVRRLFACASLPGVMLAAVAPAVSAQRPGKPRIEQAVRAMGGQERVLGIRTIVLEGTGTEYDLGQNQAPGEDLNKYEVTAYRRSIDFANSRWRQEYTREARFPAGNPAPQQLRQGYDSVAFDLIADGSARRPAGRADLDRRDQLLFHPVAFLRTALAEGADVVDNGTVKGLRQVTLTRGGEKYVMLLSPTTRLPARINRTIDHPILGDVVLTTQFSDWKRTDGVMLPMRIRQRLDDKYLVSDIRLTAVRMNADVGDLAAPSSVRTVNVAATPVNVTGQVIAPGVWYLAGQTHHSVVIEMRDHLILVEAPQNEARTIAVMQRARTLGNGKPLRTLIATHHHFDHIGGVRAAMAEGLDVITHSKNKSFFQEIARRAHTIVPDALSAASRSPSVVGVASREVLSDSLRTVEIHHIRGNPHAETLLMVYLPAEKLLIEADAYTPPPADATTRPPTPFAANLLENIERLGLAVDYVVPLHGRIVPLSDLRAAVEATRAARPPD